MNSCFCSEFGGKRKKDNRHIKEFASDMVKKGYLLDAIITEGDYTATSVRENGVAPGFSSPTVWMGVSVHKGYRVGESDKSKPYTSIHTSKRIQTPVKLQRGKGKFPEMGI